MSDHTCKDATDKDLTYSPSISLTAASQSQSSLQLSKEEQPPSFVVPFSPAIGTYRVESNSYPNNSPGHSQVCSEYDRDFNDPIEIADSHLEVPKIHDEGVILTTPSTIDVNLGNPNSNLQDENNSTNLSVPLETDAALLETNTTFLLKHEEPKIVGSPDSRRLLSDLSRTHTEGGETESSSNDTISNDLNDTNIDICNTNDQASPTCNPPLAQLSKDDFKPWYKRWYIMVPLVTFIAVLIAISIATGILFPRPPQIYARSVSVSNLQVHLNEDPIAASAKITLNLEIYNPNRYTVYYDPTRVHYSQASTTHLSEAEMLLTLLAINTTRFETPGLVHPSIQRIFLSLKDLFSNGLAVLEQLSHLPNNTQIEGFFLVQGGHIPAQSSIFLTLDSDLNKTPLLGAIFAMTQELPITAHTITHGRVNFLGNAEIDYIARTECSSMLSLELLSLALIVKEQQCTTRF